MLFSGFAERKGASPMPVQERWTLDSLIEAYKQHQRRTRGLRERTLRGYERNVRLFLRAVAGSEPIDPAPLGPAGVREFIASLRQQVSPPTMKTVATGLRLLVRVLRAEV